MSFGATLRLLRTESGLSLRELSERVGVSNTYLSRVENGHDAPPTPDRLADIARALGLPPSSLIELAHRAGSYGARYFDRVPAARDLLGEILRRDLRPTDLARIKAFIEKEFPLGTSAPSAGDARDLFSPERVILDLACTDVDDVIDVAAMRLAGQSKAAHAVGNAIRLRERECGAAIGKGVAIPHAVLPGVTPRACVVTLKRGLDLATPDGVPVRIFVVHVHPGGPRHLTLLVQLAKLADDEIVSLLTTQRDPKRLCRALAAFPF
jgi:PTS system nitrogen regulatory IIA component